MIRVDGLNIVSSHGHPEWLNNPYVRNEVQNPFTFSRVVHTPLPFGPRVVVIATFPETLAIQILRFGKRKVAKIN